MDLHSYVGKKVIVYWEDVTSDVAESLNAPTLATGETIGTLARVGPNYGGTIQIATVVWQEMSDGRLGVVHIPTGLIAYVEEVNQCAR